MIGDAALFDLFSPRALGAALLALTLGLSACAPAVTSGGMNDPLENGNRAIHGFNRGLDRALVGPASRAYTTILPRPVEKGIGNVARNLDAPVDVINNLLQARVDDAAYTTLRFAANTVIGIGGLFDVATALGMEARPTDFGETLHVWGAGEGVYLEVPFVGPSTARDFTGLVVDVAANPLRLTLPPRDANAVTGLRFANGLGQRAEFSDLVESILYDSADSYAQARLIYLQNRRFELGQTTGADGEAATDAFLDPYEDPYGP